MSFDDLTDGEQLAVKEKALRAATRDWDDARIDIDEEVRVVGRVGGRLATVVTSNGDLNVLMKARHDDMEWITLVHNPKGPPKPSWDGENDPFVVAPTVWSPLAREHVEHVTKAYPPDFWPRVHAAMPRLGINKFALTGDEAEADFSLFGRSIWDGPDPTEGLRETIELLLIGVEHQPRRDRSVEGNLLAAFTVTCAYCQGSFPFANHTNCPNCGAIFGAK